MAHPLVTVKWKPHDVYIGRPSVWGNPFVLQPDEPRGATIARYEAWLLSQPKLIERAKRELKGKVLACYAPLSLATATSWPALRMRSKV